MIDEYVLSYDLGTSAVKATLVGCDGTVAGSATESYPLLTPRESWAEQDPEDYWRGVCASTRALLGATRVSPEQLLGMVFCSQWKGIIPLDKQQRVLNNSIIWLDARAGEQARSMNRVLQFNYFKEKYFGFKPSSRLNAAIGREILCGADYWPKLMWLRQELPEVYGETQYILECASYVKWRATGVMASDLTNHFTKSFNPSAQSTYNLLLKLAKVDPGLFPPIVQPTDIVGTVTQSAAAQLGINEGTPVFGGCGDIPAIAVGAGCSGLGDAHAYFGSSGWFASMVACSEGFLSTSPFNMENDLLCFGWQAIGLSYDWALRQLYHSEYREAGGDIYAFVEKELAEIPAGSGGLLATHWMFGERPPFFSDRARGAFVNLNNTHDRRHMLNAVLESVCYSMRLALDALRSGTRREVGAVSVVGGCAVSPHWMQTLADVLEIPVNIPANPRHAGAVGAAYCALIGLGRCKDFDEAKSRVGIEKVYTPRPGQSAAHMSNYAVYKGLHGKLKDTFSALQ